METIRLQVFAGGISTVIFIFGNFPMIFKAFKTRNLKSYSLGNLALSNLGNLIHWVYVSSLPFGPIWFLHGFNTLVAALMLQWYFRYELAGIFNIRLMYLKFKWMCKCGCANASWNTHP